MKYYVQFTHAENNKMVDNLGSYGVFILDGRNSLTTMKCDAMIRMNKLIGVSHIDGYKIIRADRFTDEGTIMYEWVRSGARNI